jgi:hypothetical protein
MYGEQSVERHAVSTVMALYKALGTQCTLVAMQFTADEPAPTLTTRSFAHIALIAEMLHLVDAIDDSDVLLCIATLVRAEHLALTLSPRSARLSNTRILMLLQQVVSHGVIAVNTLHQTLGALLRKMQRDRQRCHCLRTMSTGSMPLRTCHFVSWHDSAWQYQYPASLRQTAIGTQHGTRTGKSGIVRDTQYEVECVLDILLIRHDVETVGTGHQSFRTILSM